MYANQMIICSASHTHMNCKRESVGPMVVKNSHLRAVYQDIFMFTLNVFKVSNQQTLLIIYLKLWTTKSKKISTSWSAHSIVMTQGQLIHFMNKVSPRKSEVWIFGENQKGPSDTEHKTKKIICWSMMFSFFLETRSLSFDIGYGSYIKHMCLMMVKRDIISRKQDL